MMVHSVAQEGSAEPTCAVPKTVADLPAPRLQLRWQKASEIGIERFGPGDWACHYELVLPLGEFDVRREIYKDGEQVGEQSELVAPIKPPSIRGCEEGHGPCQWRGEGNLYWDVPFRDGAHLKWDAEVLGGLPVFCIAPDGTPLTAPVDDTQPGTQPGLPGEVKQSPANQKQGQSE